MTRQRTRVVPRLPSPVLVLGAIGSVQLGSALAKTAFDQAGPLGVVLLRLGVGALVLLALARPRPSRRSRRQVVLVIAFGAALAALNGTFYAAIGVVLLTRVGGGALDPLGLGLAGCAAACWAAYILLSQRVGQAFSGPDGLALATAVAAILATPLGVAQAGGALGEWRVLAVGAGVGLLSAAIPYSLEIEALRRLPARVFGVLMSLEPAVGALAGLVILGETLRSREVLAIALVCVASAGAAWAGRSAPLD